MKFTFEIEFEQNALFVNGMKFERFAHTRGMHEIGNAIALFMCRKQDVLNGLYSKQVYWPKLVDFSVKYAMSCKYSVMPTLHCERRAKEYGLGNAYKAMMYGEVIEAEFDSGTLTKIVTRLPHRYNEAEDICAAIAFDYVEGEDGYNIECRVKTLWLNDRNDNHLTIDESKYVHGKN